MKLKLLFILSFAAGFGYAQDQIYKKDSTLIEAKILEIYPSEVRYKLFSYQDGPVISLAKSEIRMIIYQNGMREEYNQPSIPQDTMLQKQQVNDDPDEELFNRLVSTKQVVFLNLPEIYDGCLSLSYLREFANNRLNFYLPVSIGLKQDFIMERIHYSLDNNPSNIKYFRTIDVGAGLNYQITHKTQHVFFVGVLAGMNQYRGTYDYYTSEIKYGYYSLDLLPHTYIANNYYLMTNAGGLFRISRHFNFMLNLASGYRKTEYISGDPENAGPTTAEHLKVKLFGHFIAKVGISLGYRF